MTPTPGRRTGRWVAATLLVCLTPVARTVDQTMHMRSGEMPATSASAPASEPALCRLLGTDPVVVPANGLDRAQSPYLHLADDTRHHQLVIEVGPVDLPAHAMAEHTEELVYQLTYVPFDAWVHGFRVTLRGARGQAVPRRMLHHIDTTRPDAADLFLPVAQRFVALGAETSAQWLPGWLVGVPLHRGEPLLVSTMLHNPTATAYTGVRVRLSLAYTRSRPRIEVAGFRLDVMFPTGPMEFDLPAGRTVRSWVGSPRARARLLGITGHLHKYAEWMKLEDVTAREVLWQVRPRTNPEGELTGMPVSLPRLGRGWLVFPTHRYRITASYFNPTDKTIPEGGMAKVAGVYTPVDSLPPVVVRDALYQSDLRYLLGLRCGGERTMQMLATHMEHDE